MGEVVEAGDEPRGKLENAALGHTVWVQTEEGLSLLISIIYRFLPMQRYSALLFHET